MKKLRCRRCGLELVHEYKKNRLGELYWRQAVIDGEEVLGIDYLCLPNLWINDPDPEALALFHDPLPWMTETEWRGFIGAQLDLMMA